MKLEKFLLPTDFSAPSLEACRRIVADAAPGAKFELLHVIDAGQFLLNDPYANAWPSGLEQALREEAEKRMARALEELRARPGIQVTGKISLGPCVTSICERARSGFDAVAMSTHGRTGWNHFLLGSVAERVVQRSPIPVLTLPARKEDAQ